MCGLSGFINSKSAEYLFQPVLASMLNSIAHRGPDGTGFWFDEKLGVAIGHKRLAIHDLSIDHMLEKFQSCSHDFLDFPNQDL